jgi:hypothetical protein
MTDAELACEILNHFAIPPNFEVDKDGMVFRAWKNHSEYTSIIGSGTSSFPASDMWLFRMRNHEFKLRIRKIGEDFFKSYKSIRDALVSDGNKPSRRLNCEALLIALKMCNIEK